MTDDRTVAIRDLLADAARVNDEYHARMAAVDNALDESTEHLSSLIELGDRVETDAQGRFDAPTTAMLRAVVSGGENALDASEHHLNAVEELTRDRRVIEQRADRLGVAVVFATDGVAIVDESGDDREVYRRHREEAGETERDPDAEEDD